MRRVDTRRGDLFAREHSSSSVGRAVVGFCDRQCRRMRPDLVFRLGDQPILSAKWWRDMSEQTRGTLGATEPHPSSCSAMAWLKTLDVAELYRWREAFASCAIEGSRLGEVCLETLNRLLDNQPVSDRYLLGLAWAMKHEESIANGANE